MMTIRLSLVVLAACGPSVPRTDSRVVARNELVARSGDARALEELMRGGVTNGGLWFDDAACAGEFGVAGEVPAGKVAAFARCVVGLHLEASAREDALGDVTVMRYAPGIEIEGRVQQDRGPHLTWIGFASRSPGDPDVPTITHEALQALVLGTNEPAQVAAGEMTWLKVCLDANGSLTRTEDYETTSTDARKAFTEAISHWRFRPFTLRGQPVAVCSMLRMTASPTTEVERLPLSPPLSRSKARPIVFANARALEGKRIAGMKNVVPDDMTKIEIQQSGVSRIVGEFRLCLDETGAPESVLPLRSTTFADYDAKLLRAIWAWKYSPYLIDGQPVPLCTTIKFIYSQR